MFPIVLLASLTMNNSGCWGVMPGGVEMDLSHLCPGYSVPAPAQTAPSASAPRLPSFPPAGAVAASPQHPFPGWLISGDPDTRDAYETGIHSGNRTLLQAYDNRFLVRFRRWPHTLLATNRAEWTYIDCATGWGAEDDFPFVGTSEITFFPPSALPNPVIHRDNCGKVGIQASF